MKWIIIDYCLTLSAFRQDRQLLVSASYLNMKKVAQLEKESRFEIYTRLVDV
jgi:hypothetical protein